MDWFQINHDTILVTMSLLQKFTLFYFGIEKRGTLIAIFQSKTDRQILAAFLTTLSYLISGLVFSPISHRTEEILWPFHLIDLNIDLSCLSWLEMHWNNLVQVNIWRVGAARGEVFLFLLLLFFFFLGGEEKGTWFSGERKGESIVAMKGDHKNTPETYGGSGKFLSPPFPLPPSAPSRR